MLSTVLIIASWVLVALACVAIARSIRKCNVVADRRRKVKPIAVGGFIIWAVGGALLWSPIIEKVPKFITPVLTPLVVTTWPAHEVASMLSGKGLGASTALPFNIPLVAGCVVWAAILWAPLLALRVRKVPLWLGLTGQVAFFVTVAALFNRFGNG